MLVAVSSLVCFSGAFRVAFAQNIVGDGARALFREALGYAPSNEITSVQKDGRPLSKGTASVDLFGVRLSILKRNTGRRFEPVSTRHSFKTGDGFKVQLQTLQDSFVYVFVQGTTDELKLIYPDQSTNKNNFFKKGELRVAPEGSKPAWRLDQNPGTEHLFFVLTRNAIKNFAEYEQQPDRLLLESLLMDEAVAPERPSPEKFVSKL